MSNVKITIIFLIIFASILPNFVLAQAELPETIEETKELGEKFLEKSREQLPGILKNIWQKEVLHVWRKMYEIWSNWWHNHIQPWLRSICKKIQGIIEREIEKRKPQVEKEIQKEKEQLKEEIKKELPETNKSLWERFKELIK